MAFSLKSLFKGKKKSQTDGLGIDPEDDPFAPSGADEIPAMEAEKIEAAAKKKRKKKKAKGPLAKLLAKLPSAKKRKAAAEGPDPFDNPEVMALIASEVAALPPPEAGDADEAEAPPPPEKPGAPVAAVGAPEEDDGPFLDEGGTDAAASATSAADPMADPFAEGTAGLSDDDEAAFGALAAMEEDDEAEAEYFRRRRRNNIIGSSIAASVLLLLAGGGWWMMNQIDVGTDGEDMPAAGELRVYSEVDGLAAPGQAQSGDRIRMALPPPPEATPPTVASETSLARRPWLNEGGTVSGETTATTPAATETADAPAETETPDPTTVAEAPAETEQPAAPVAAEPPAVAEAPTPDDSPAPQTTADAPQLAGLPPLKEPSRPPPPADAPTMPTFDALPAAPPAPQGLTPAPMDGLVRQGPLGPLPVKAADGRTPWESYARPFDQPDKPHVVLIVTGLGLNPAATDAAITRLPPAITLAFSPYAKNLGAQVAKARSFGHEVLIDLPMEPENFPAQDPGPLAMLTALPQNENLTRLETILGKATGYTGVVSRFGGKYGASRVHMRTVLESLSERGLMYVHAAPPDGLRENADLAVPTAEALLTVDERPFRESIDARLKYLAEAAKIRGTAVGIAHPYPVTFERLVRFIGELEALGVALAPASAAAQLPATAATPADDPPRRG